MEDALVCLSFWINTLKFTQKKREEKVEDGLLESNVGPGPSAKSNGEIKTNQNALIKNLNLHIKHTNALISLLNMVGSVRN